MKFYRMLADAPTRWYLGAPIDGDGRDVDPRIFTEGTRVDVKPPIKVALRRLGIPIDFNFCDFDMPVCPASLNVELEALAGPAIQRIPVQVESFVDTFEILNVLDRVACIDDTQSLFTRWTSDDGRPDKTGGYRMIAKLRIDARLAAGHDLFRIREWSIALIASERVKDIFERRQTKGVRFDEVG